MKYKILVADDVKEMRDLLGAILSKEGYHVIYAENGQEVIQYLHQDKNVDLVLLDIGMPLLNGIDVLKSLKSLGLCNKVCFISGNRDKFVVQKAIANGGHDYIVKPVSRLTVIEKVKRLLAKNELQMNTHFCCVKLLASFWNLPLLPDFYIVGISEDQILIHSHVSLSAGTNFDFNSLELNKLTQTSDHFSCVVNRIEKGENEYLLYCSLVGVTDSVYKNISSFIMNQSSAQHIA